MRLPVRRLVPAIALVCALTACSDASPGGTTSAEGSSTGASTAGTTSAPTMPPAPTSGAPTGAPTSAAPSPGGTGTIPPLGPDLACLNIESCYLKNPNHLSDEKLVDYFSTVKGAKETPAPNMKPWAYVVLGAGSQKLAASTEPGPGGKPVTDQYGIINHRALFAYCRVAEGGGAVGDGTPREKTWFKIDPITPGGDGAQVWMNGRYLHAYGHNGAIPAC